MPYRRPYRKRYYRRRNNRYRNTAQKALRIAKAAYKLPELKYTQQTRSATGTSYNGGLIQEVATVSQGAGRGARVGNTIKPTSVHLRPDWSDADSWGSSTINVRLIVFRWVSEVPSTGFGNATEVLESATLNSFKSIEKRYQSEILYDRTFYSDNRDVEYMPPLIKIKLKHPIGYDDNLSTANRNGIYYMVLNDSSTTTLTYPIDTQLFYRDA